MLDFSLDHNYTVW